LNAETPIPSNSRDTGLTKATFGQGGVSGVEGSQKVS